jgi:hypothetical protein
MNMTRREMTRRGWIACLGIALAPAAYAGPLTVPLSDFVIFSGGAGTGNTGGFETSIGGHTWITGNIGSNQDLFQQGNPLPGYPARLAGSAYAGGNLTFGQDLTVNGSAVVNGAAAIGGGASISGTLDAASYTLGSGASVAGGIDTSATRKTFALITMPAATSFTAGGVNQTVPTGQGNSLTLAPGAYGALATSSQNQAVILSSGNYYFSSITTQGGFDLKIDLSSGDPVNIFVVGSVALAGRQELLVKGAGTGGAFVPISQATQLAGLIYLETHAQFSMTGGLDGTHNIWGGTVYASFDVSGNSPEIGIGQYTDWYGAAWAADAFATADHGRWVYVPLATDGTVSEPATLGLMGLGLVGLGFASRRRPRPTSAFSGTAFAAA